MTVAAVLETTSVREFTAKVAAAVAAEHARDPGGELLVWLHMALRREASVGEMYGFANLERRLRRLRAPRPMVGLLRRTIANIWAQEKAHAAYLEAVLSAVARPAGTWHRLGARLDGFLGAMEGQVLSGRTSPSNLQRVKAALMLAVGRRVQDVPGFVSSLAALSFRDFCLLNAELESTAVHGYLRMSALLQERAMRPRLSDDTTLEVDIARMVRDERFHDRAFAAMVDWFEPASGDTLRPGVSFDACAARLRDIRAQLYVDEEPAPRVMVR